MPVSPCGAGCLTHGDPEVPRWRAVLRLAALAGVVGAAVVSVPVLLVSSRAVRDRTVRGLCRAVLAACGVVVAVRGRWDGADGADGGALVVHNHISWLDVVGLGAVRPMLAVAKREVGDWPLLGALVARAGGVFLDRERLSGLPASVAEVADLLRAGEQVVVTPEGTTWCGGASGAFRPALFQAALDAGVPVRPVAVRYRLGRGRPTTRPAFVGPESLLESLWRTVRLRGTVLELVGCPEIPPGRVDGRRALAALARTAVHTAPGAPFGPPHPGAPQAPSGTPLRP
ncbi:lysophospholipid acyltransferase family protein [Saccharomonospora halophila]|uniref:lysophospholipid acyltransferase family protein n=1 Tax=Saccharomonospora halophila TaxID=129922 RepID=UPI0003619BAC|nr:lysophospholipid acyltransferase family protein [Saccharomonospora halophila]